MTNARTATFPLHMQAAIDFLAANKAALIPIGHTVRGAELGVMGAVSVDDFCHQDGRRFRFEQSNGGCTLIELNNLS